MASFDDSPKTQIFESRSVLKASENLNKEPVNQQTVRSALQSIVDLLGKGKVPPVLFLSGPSGSGKTYLTLHCFKQRQSLNTPTKVSTVRIERMAQTKSGNALSLLCEQFDDQLPSPTDAPQIRYKTSDTAREVKEKIQERLQTLSSPVAVILDEFELTETIQDIIRDVLLSLRTETTGIPLSLVFLSYKAQYEVLADCFDSGGPVHIELDQYSQEEMTRILSQRAADAFRSGAVSKENLKRCAKIAVERNATPQGAQELLMRAGDEAKHTGERTVSELHIQKAVVEMESTTWS